MSITVITLKKVPQVLKGTLTRWMQEIATGVFIGNFNPKIRDELWHLVTHSGNTGEATMSFQANNEIGYSFKTMNTQRKVINSNGIPLVYLPFMDENPIIEKGFSKAYKHHMARKFAKSKQQSKNYVFIDIETTGLNYKTDKIIEIGALKQQNKKVKTFSRLIKINEKVPKNITTLTGITDEMLIEDGDDIENALNDFLNFIGNGIIVGYNVNFDLFFLNKILKDNNLKQIQNDSIDLMSRVKKENKRLKKYKFINVLSFYKISNTVSHRALQDAKNVYKLFLKLNKK